MIRKKDVIFYSLPNGELSHHNLFEAIKDLFKKNNDDLGMLLTSWYFDFNAPERGDKASTKIIQFENQPMMDCMSAAGPSNDSDLEQTDDQRVNNYNFFYFGYGYCPVLERVKWNPVFKHNKNKKKVKTFVGQNNYNFPAGVCVKVTVQKEVKPQLKRMSFHTKDDYLRNRMIDYGLNGDDDVELWSQFVDRFRRQMGDRTIRHHSRNIHFVFSRVFSGESDIENREPGQCCTPVER